jgi:predicted DNA-binding transcriptional regulator AlpA
MSLEHSPARQKKSAASPYFEGERLLTKAEVCDRVGKSFPTIWLWMQAGKFPHARDSANGLPVWLESEIAEWMRALPVKLYKGDADAEQTNAKTIRAAEASVESRRRAKAAKRRKNVQVRSRKRGRKV